MEAEAQLTGRDRANLAALREEARKSELTDRFISLATDPRVRRQLFFIASQIPNGGERRSVRNTIWG
ncbi:MAG: hypothetical protein U0232_15775 [Thermomicrobiales bacterium]